MLTIGKVKEKNTTGEGLKYVVNLPSQTSPSKAIPTSSGIPQYHEESDYTFGLKMQLSLKSDPELHLLPGC